MLDPAYNSADKNAAVSCLKFVMGGINFAKRTGCSVLFFFFWFPPVVSWESPLEYSYVGSGVCRK